MIRFLLAALVVALVGFSPEESKAAGPVVKVLTAPVRLPVRFVRHRRQHHQTALVSVEYRQAPASCPCGPSCPCSPARRSTVPPPEVLPSPASVEAVTAKPPSPKETTVKGGFTNTDSDPPEDGG